jgi:peptidoglycan hydrolase-like protein with peptidoglycan-binding domain
MAALIGETGSRVVAIQQALNQNAQSCVIADDGVFGRATQAAVIEFQKRYNRESTFFMKPINESGIVDDATAAALGVNLDGPKTYQPKGSCGGGTHPGTSQPGTPPPSDGTPSWDWSQGGAYLPKTPSSGGGGAFMALLAAAAAWKFTR